ncbi:MAG: phytanoyl-CoA dioxygenase family protein [Candidatus Marinimicrobia bacterium]|nr:phytanoyl-CoA dioxygenase family protein [Candidatus Neomarinimicrobiota bacterium]MCF7850904.1 phytanoyl-CoA dioxygenase family protein [Candidatus Neomarinimicrobiota bacterium]MCF7905128.1 phytanoyl-CoA dioxygenase family protein [Candidatus Neomarinimicrobiota bacterium]
MKPYMINSDQINRYHEDGYFILDNVFDRETLEMLREECDIAIAAQNHAMDREGSNSLGLSHRDSRYFVFLPSVERPRLREFIFSKFFYQIGQKLIGEPIYLFWDQFVAKFRDQKSVFNWHQDSGYVDTPHKPYLNCWIPLDDVNEVNGTISILPYSKAGTKEKIPHSIPEDGGDRIGYTGTDPGDLIEVPAGSLVVFSSVALHRSGPNQTDKMRRAYSMQFSSEPIYETDGTLKGLAEPFILPRETKW